MGVPDIRELPYTPCKNEKEINQGLDVRAGDLPECYVWCITGKRRQSRLPTDKGLQPNGVSLYILDGMGSTSPY